MKMTPEKENEIRLAWGEYVLGHGRPLFRGGAVRLVKRPPLDLSMDVSDAPVVVEVFDYRLETKEIADARGVFGKEYTVSCEGVIVFRDWKAMR
jgi:hypothetical protein